MAFGFHIIEYEIMGCQMTRRKRSELGATDEEMGEQMNSDEAGVSFFWSPVFILTDGDSAQLE